MGWNGSGQVVRTDGVRTGANLWQQAHAAGVDIEPDDHDVHDQDLAAAIARSLNIDGENAPTTDISWGNFKLTSLGAATTAGDALGYGQNNAQLGDSFEIGDSFKAGSGAQFTDDLLIVGDAAPVSVEYFRDGNNNELAKVVAAGDNDAGSKIEYVEVQYKAGDTTTGSEDGQIDTLLTFGGISKRLASILLPNALRVYGYGSGASNAGALELRNINGSPSNGDLGTWIRFFGSNSNSDLEQFASIFAKHATVTDGAEDGELGWNIKRGGSDGVRMRLGAGLGIGSDDPPTTPGVLNVAVGYQLGGTALVVAETLDEETVSNAASYDVVWDNANGYKKIEIIVSGLRPASDAQPLLRTSTDGGENYDGGASDYAYGAHFVRQGDSGANVAAAASAIQLANGNVESDDGNSCSYTITVLHPGDAGSNTTINFHGRYIDTLARLYHITGSGERRSEADVDGVRLLFSTGNIAEMRVTVLGYR